MSELKSKPRNCAGCQHPEDAHEVGACWQWTGTFCGCREFVKLHRQDEATR